MNAFFVAQQPKLGIGRLCAEDSRLHTNTYKHIHTHTHTVGLLRTIDQFVIEAATYTRHKHETNFHVHSGIRTHDPSNRVTVELRCRLAGIGRECV